MIPIMQQTLAVLPGVILLAGLVELLPSPRQSTAPQTPPPHIKRLSPVEVESLIARLGSEDYHEREAATTALKRRPEAALALLRIHRTTESTEVKQRLASILPAMMSREGAEKRLAQLASYVEQRQLDRLVETMVACREYISSEHDLLVQAFIKSALASATVDKAPRWADNVQIKTGTFAWHNRLAWFRPDIPGPTIVARSAPAISGPGTGIIASDLIRGGSLNFGVVLCNGNVDIQSAAFSVLIVTGTVRVGIGGVDGAVIIALDDVDVDGGSGAIVVTSGRLNANSGSGLPVKEHSSIRERDTRFFRTWNLYSANEAGATLWSAFGFVWVVDVAPDSPFARAGIRSGDILARIDGSPIHSIREANRLLCRATVSWGETDLSIMRHGKTRDIIVSLQEW